MATTDQPIYVSTHSRLKAAGTAESKGAERMAVSTHSRLKAAGLPTCKVQMPFYRFNTQPPEGGWFVRTSLFLIQELFQHTAA